MPDVETRKCIGARPQVPSYLVSWWWSLCRSLLQEQKQASKIYSWSDSMIEWNWSWSFLAAKISNCRITREINKYICVRLFLFYCVIAHSIKLIRNKSVRACRSLKLGKKVAIRLHFMCMCVCVYVCSLVCACVRACKCVHACKFIFCLKSEITQSANMLMMYATWSNSKTTIIFQVCCEKK